MKGKKIFIGCGIFAFAFSMTSSVFAAEMTAGVNLSVTVAENMTLICGSDVDIDDGTMVIPGSPVSNTTTCTVTTNDESGYNLSVADDRGSDNALYHSDPTLAATLDGQITDKPAWDPTLNTGDGNAITWAGTGLGFGVLSSEATKNTTWWGTGALCEDATQQYAGLPDVDTNIMEHTAYSSTSTDTVICYRADVPSTQVSGEYIGSVTYTATGRP